jgi:hypothetical protein
MMTIARKKRGGGYTGAYLMGKGRKAPTKAARVNIKVKAFIEALITGSWTWTRYFCAAIPESANPLAKRELRPCKNQVRNDAVISVSIGALEAFTCFRNIYWIKNVLHKARTNPQVA